MRARVRFWPFVTNGWCLFDAVVVVPTRPTAPYQSPYYILRLPTSPPTISYGSLPVPLLYPTAPYQSPYYILRLPTSPPTISYGSLPVPLLYPTAPYQSPYYIRRRGVCDRGSLEPPAPERASVLRVAAGGGAGRVGVCDGGHVGGAGGARRGRGDERRRQALPLGQAPPTRRGACGAALLRCCVAAMLHRCSAAAAEVARGVTRGRAGRWCAFSAFSRSCCSSRGSRASRHPAPPPSAPSSRVRVEDGIVIFASSCVIFASSCVIFASSCLSCGARS